MHLVFLPAVPRLTVASLVACAGLGLGLSACLVESPCSDYVSYICDCHADDPEFDCEEASRAYENADSAVQDACFEDLRDLQDEDVANGWECGGTTTTGGGTAS